MMFLWALHYPTGAQYRVHSSTCTAPRWVGHGTQHCFQEKDFPFPSHPSHMSFIIISWCYNKDLPVILSVMHTLSSSRHLLFLKNASAGPQVAETIHRHRRNAKEEECEFINIYISNICFLHGHISGLDFWDPNQHILISLQPRMPPWRLGGIPLGMQTQPCFKGHE